MSTCSSGCPTQDHASYGECMRSKAARVAYCDSSSGRDYTRQKQWDSTLDAYRAARKEGIQPSGTSREQIETARRISDATGEAWQA